MVGLVLAIVPLFAGFIPVLFTARRRGLPDFLAGTVVVYDDASPEAGDRLKPAKVPAGGLGRHLTQAREGCKGRRTPS